RADYELFVNSQPAITRPPSSKKEIKSLAKKDRPDLAAELNFIQTLDPQLGYPTPEVLADVLHQSKTKRLHKTKVQTDTLFWTERGPTNVGGRTRTLMVDPNDLSKQTLWAGAVSGGLWKNENVFSFEGFWENVSDFWSSFPISAMTYDPLNTQIFYVGTGEGFYGRASVGSGIWKSNDGGSTWNWLENTQDMNYVLDVKTRVEEGKTILYVSSGSYSYEGSTFGTSGLYRSADDGLTFTEVLSSSGQSLRPGRMTVSAQDTTLWIPSLNGRIYKLDASETNATLVHSVSGQRVELDVCQAFPDVIFAVYESNNTVGQVIKSSNGGQTWQTVNEPLDPENGIPNNDFSREQAWYDLVIKVDPRDSNTVLAGAVNLFKTTDGAQNWEKISTWWEADPSEHYVHADQHEALFFNGSPDTVLVSNDGGVFLTTNFTNLNPDFEAINSNYNVTQFYAADFHRTKERYLAGAQDNGTQYFNGIGKVGTNEVSGGDGAYCFFDDIDDDFIISSSQYNHYYMGTPGSMSTLFDGSGGSFINASAYDPNLNILYTSRSNTIINRIFTDNTTPQTLYKQKYSNASYMDVAPFDTERSNLYVGTFGGRIYKFLNANTTNFTAEAIQVSAMPNATVSGIDFGESEDELLVSFSNYGVQSVWYTTDGGETWRDIEGNLPNIPVRSCLFNPFDRQQVLIATELGIWFCNDIHQNEPHWEQINDGIPNVRVDMLRGDRQTGKILAATHGRGLFTSTFIDLISFKSLLNAPVLRACLPESFTFESQSLNPDSVRWTFSTDQYEVRSGGLTENSIEVEFLEAGYHEVKLLAFGNTKRDSSLVNIEVVDKKKPKVFRDYDNLSSSETGDYYLWFKNGVSISGTNSPYYTATEPGYYQVRVSNNGDCDLRSDSIHIERLGNGFTYEFQLDYLATNPYLTLSIDGLETFTFKLINMQGQVLYETAFSQLLQVDLNSYAKGNYIIIVEEKGNDKLVFSRKIVRL
ncbi:MAG: T9SS type A sorting domain-containing protein, partial [Flavobacteriales bacterium]